MLSIERARDDGMREGKSVRERERGKMSHENSGNGEKQQQQQASQDHHHHHQQHHLLISLEKIERIKQQQ